MSAKIAVVTGAGSGIGLAVAKRLSGGGWTIVLAGRTAGKLEAAAKSLQGETLCVPTDVASEADVDNLFEQTRKAFGRVDLLFNNAGIASGQASIEDVHPTDFQRVINTNVTGCFLCARAAMKLMKTHGGGRIVNNGSLSAHVPRPGSVAYTVSKHAVLGLTKSIALDGRAINVACGQIDFGNVVSEMSQAMVGGPGALQASGERLQEPTMTLEDAAETVWAMANLPLSANVLTMTVMATKMPYVGRG
jgi:NADP-dependent 3-hydroxy acid dehydrogenase YdfG